MMQLCCGQTPQQQLQLDVFLCNLSMRQQQLKEHVGELDLTSWLIISDLQREFTAVELDWYIYNALKPC